MGLAYPLKMPVIVVGADTEIGLAVVDALIEPDREVRAFVTDPEIARELKERGVKVAIGDTSDDSHVEAASLNCFSAVLISHAAVDDRERAFAQGPRSVMEGWARAVRSVQRVIWVDGGDPPMTSVAEQATVDPSLPPAALAARVRDLDSYDSAAFRRALGER